MLLDGPTIARNGNLPQQSSTGGFSVAQSLTKLNGDLNNIGIYNARTFSTRVKLVNGN